MYLKAFNPSALFCIVLYLAPFVSGSPYNDKSDGPLAYSFYDKSCPNLFMIVSRTINYITELLSLFVAQGCDGSVLLDDTNTFKGEKNAFPNHNSIRGFEVIDSIKADVEKSCPSTVSCADVLALAAREAVVLSGGPFWLVSFGRLDSLTASEKSANEQLPAPFEPIENITAKFLAKGLDLKDMVVLSGGHTIGFAQCLTFKNRLFNFKGSGKPDPSLDPSMLSGLQTTCPNIDQSNSKLAPLDSQSMYRFDNMYYKSLMNNNGLLESDQALVLDTKTAAMVKDYSADPFLFATHFAASMVKLGNTGVLTGQGGEIRKKCGSVN
ncbi:Peroxidase 10 [Sesamum angolense]|uniref:Peroxidase n=1 Tax=Sesamum angolense TaxID=2727404 RepID=A0AAE2C163_9LAMI|nr:Peroxidase 10 [Sesamum angolense]